MIEYLLLPDKKPNYCCNPVLIVDDMSFNVKSLSMILQYVFNLNSDQCFSGEQALERVEERLSKTHFSNCPSKFPLILTDINMPEMDGI